VTRLWKGGLWLAIPMFTAACGDKQAADNSYADAVAQRFLADSAKIHPPNAKLAKELEFLNACTVRHIRSSGIAYGDTEESINTKIQAAMQRCSDELYGKSKP